MSDSGRPIALARPEPRHHLPSPSGLLRFVLYTLDRPALASAELAHRHLGFTLALACAGLFGVALATLAATAMVGDGSGAAVLQVDALRAFLEATLIAVPAVTIVSGHLRVEMGARALVAAAAIGLLAAALTTLCLLPLVAFLVIVDAGKAIPPLVPGLAFPLLALAVLAEFMARAIRALDPSWRGRFVVISLALLFSSAFVARVLPLLQALLDGRTP